MTEFIQLSPTSRLAIDVDEAAPNPREHMELATGCFTPNPIFGPRLHQGPVELFRFPGDLSEAHDRLSRWGEIDPERDVQRWAWANYGVHVEMIGWTYWFCDRSAFALVHGGDFTREAQRALIQSESAMYQRWIECDARIVKLERLARFKRVSPRHTTFSKDMLRVWECIESVGNIYTDDSYSYADVAYEILYEAMDEKERTIVQAMLDEQQMEREGALS